MFSSSNLSDDGAEAISDYLSKSSILCKLNVSHTGITILGAVKIANALKVNTTLKKLDISSNSISNSITDDGAIAFGDCPKTNNTLVKLDLSLNRITIKSMGTFSEAIEVNKSLRTLKLGCQRIIGKDALNFNLTILHAMYMNKTIMKLYLPDDTYLCHVE